MKFFILKSEEYTMSKLVNFRDLGGYKTADGKRIRSKRLLRSAHIDALLETDIDFLREYNIKLIVDFRFGVNTTETPISRLLGSQYENIDIVGEVFKQHDGFFNMLKNSTIEEVREFTRTGYEKVFITNTSAIDGYTKFLKLCTEDYSGAILFHCSFGKDRTGFATALILKILGVSDNDIFRDYLKSSDETKSAMDGIIAKYLSRGICKEKTEIICELKREYLESAFEIIEQRHNSFGEYVEKVLGITQEDIAKLKTLYLEQISNGH